MLENKQIIIDGVDVSGCERHCSDNRNNPNMCYSEVNRTYSNCNPKEKQCNFYITSIEKQLKRKEQKLAKIKEILEIHKDNKCVICPKFDECFEQPSCDNVILQIIEVKENE